MTVVEVVAAAIVGFLGLVVLCVAGLAILTASVFADDVGAWIADKTPDLVLKMAGVIMLAAFASLVLFLSYSVGLAIIEWVEEVLA